MSNRFIRAGLIIFLVGIVCCQTAFAFDGKAMRGPKAGEGDKFFKNIHFILKNKGMFGLSDEQMQKIMDIKMGVKKDTIRNNAEIEIVGLDIKSELAKDKINLKAVNKLIDKKYNLKKGKAKTLVAAYAKIKGILTPEQLATLKDVRLYGLKKYHHGAMGMPGGAPSCPYPRGPVCPAKDK